MFQPISQIPYHILDENQQILICCFEGAHTRRELTERWKNRAAATFFFAPNSDLCDVVRDLLANPQVRAIVFDGSGPAENVFYTFWRRQSDPGWKINEEHLELVRQFVDLFNDDCRFHKPQQPFWPQRLKYQEDK